MTGNDVSHVRRAPGIIYFMRNPYHAQGLVKVGLTTRVSEERTRELSAATGVPSEFEVMYEEHVADAALADGSFTKNSRDIESMNAESFSACR